MKVATVVGTVISTVNIPLLDQHRLLHVVGPQGDAVRSWFDRGALVLVLVLRVGA